MDVFIWVLAGILGGLFGRFLSIYIERYIHRRREEQFIRFVRVVFPNAKVIETISTSSSDKQAIENIERRLRDASRTL